MNEYRQNSDILDECCQIALSQPLPDKQLILMTHASFQVAGSAVLTEDDPTKITSARQSFVERRTPLAYVSKIFTLSKKMMSIYAKEFLAIYLATKCLEAFLGITGICYDCDREQITNTIISNQNDSSTIKERA